MPFCALWPPVQEMRPWQYCKRWLVIPWLWCDSCTCSFFWCSCSLSNVDDVGDDGVFVVVVAVAVVAVVVVVVAAAEANAVSTAILEMRKWAGVAYDCGTSSESAANLCNAACIPRLQLCQLGPKRHEHLVLLKPALSLAQFSWGTPNKTGKINKYAVEQNNYLKTQLLVQ